MPFVVESQITDNTGRTGVARIYVVTEDRAKELAGAPGAQRTYHEIDFLDMPEVAVARMRGQ